MKSTQGDYLKLSPCRFAFAFGLIWAIFCLLLGWAGWLWNYGVPLINVLGSVYFGYAPTLLGGIYGAICGFVDAFIFAILVALLYNCCGRHCCRHRHREEIQTRQDI